MALRLESPSVLRGYHLVRVFKSEDELLAEGPSYTNRDIIRNSEEVTLADALIVAGIIAYHELHDEGYTTMLVVYPLSTVTRPSGEEEGDYD